MSVAKVPAQTPYGIYSCLGLSLLYSAFGLLLQKNEAKQLLHMKSSWLASLFLQQQLKCTVQQGHTQARTGMQGKPRHR